MPQCCHLNCHEKVVHSGDCAGRGIEAPNPNNGAPILTKTESIRTLQQDNKGHARELQSIFLSIKENCLENTEVLKQVVERGEEATTNPERLSYSKAECQLKRRWTRKSVTVPQRWTYRLRRKGCRCKATDSRAMGSTAPWYRKGGTSVESSIPCSHGGRALVVKGAEKVENTEANSKYQDKAEGQRPKNFIRPVSTRFPLN
ncbi:hypothetical protein B296_00055885 [Ensete ventricosum]|uniref:Uncharacterized protein n=1 Tax=Ensete ventricosum TaxID=4639 RepID=A0A426XFT7_ENSVE|nr:hypothetical protein B296_00055885 [Ensete ventricosum]